MAAPTYDYRIDWNGDGDFTDTGENVSSRLLANPEVTIQYGRDQGRALSPTAPGEAGFALDNGSRDYSPENGSSPLAGNILPSRPVRIQATHLSTTYTLYRGFTDGYDLDPSPGSRSVSISCQDALARLAGFRVSTPLYYGPRTGQAINYLLDAVGWPAADRDIDPGATLIPYWWGEGDTGEELTNLVASEGPPALVTVDPDGKFVFRDRHHRLLRTASTTSQATIRDAGADPRFSWPLGYDHGWRDVINDALFEVGIRQPESTRSVVWSDEGIVSIADGNTVEITVQASDPFFGALTPVATVDYLSTGTVTVTLSRDSGTTAVLSLRASGGSATVRNLQLRAYSLPVARTVQIHAEDTTSIGTSAQPRYGRRTWPNPAPWAGIHDALAIAQVVLAHRAERLPIVSVRLSGGNDTILTQQLTRDLSDRVTVVDAETGLNDPFYIERIEHSIRGAGERIHATVFGCEKAPTVPANVFRFDDTTNDFNNGVFGQQGLDDPANIFVFNGSSGHRFNEGLLAT